MLRLVYAVALGILGAGIVHITILFLLPELSQRDAWTQLETMSPLYQPVRLDPGRAGFMTLQPADPLFLSAACRFDLSDGALSVVAEGTVPFWSLSIFDRNGQNIYSVTDRVNSDRVLDLFVLTPAQRVAMRDDLPEGSEGSIFVETDTRLGMVVVRSFVPDPSWRPAISRFLDGMSCRPIATSS